MNFDFTIRAHGFEKAAAVEAALKNIGVPYEVNMSKPVNGKKRTRVVIDKATVAVVANCLSRNPKFSVAEVAKRTKVSRATVQRIKSGTHVLQKQDKKLKVVR